jgi:hypothetical protein
MAGSTAVAVLATALWNKLLRAPASAVAPGGDSGGDSGVASPAADLSGRRAAGRPAWVGRATDPGPAAGVSPVVLRGPVAPPARPGRIVGPATRLPDTYLLFDEAVLGAVQHGRDIRVRGPAGAVARRPARVWWREVLRWLAARPDLSLAITALDPLGPGARAAAAVEPGTGVVSRSGTRVRVGTFALPDLVRGPGVVSAQAAAAACSRALAAGPVTVGAVPTDGGRWRRRVVLVGLHEALCRLGVDPRTYRGLRLTERLIETAVRAVEEAAVARGSDGEPPLGRPWPTAVCDVARLRRGRLTVLSPFEFLPANGDRTREWLDLLPAVRLVDAVGWRRPRRLRGCGIEELATLYRLTWAARRAGSA